MAGDNSTTKFELAFMILWILVTLALLALVILRKITLPNAIKGDKIFSMIFAGLQFVIFVLLLAALADDSWSYQSSGGFSMSSGVTHLHGSGGYSESYDTLCSNSPSDYKTSCHTIMAAGAFTLIFGLCAIFVAVVLAVVVILSLFGITQIDPLKPYVDIMANCQWILMFAMVMIWGVAGHDVGKHMSDNTSGLRLGDSWILCFVDTIFAVTSALFFAGGAGESYKGGEASAPAQSAGPTPNQPTAPAQTV